MLLNFILSVWRADPGSGDDLCLMRCFVPEWMVSISAAIGNKSGC